MTACEGAALDNMEIINMEYIINIIIIRNKNKILSIYYRFILYWQGPLDNMKLLFW